MKALQHPLLLLVALSFYGVNAQVANIEGWKESNDKTIAELRQSLSELIDSYTRLCSELSQLSRYVALHEKSLQHMVQFGHGRHNAGHGGYPHHHRVNLHQDYSHTSSSNETQSSSQIQLEATEASVDSLDRSSGTVNTTSSGWIDHAAHKGNRDHRINHGRNVIDSPRCEVNVTEKCSVFHQLLCRSPDSLSSDNQTFEEYYNKWFATLVSTDEMNDRANNFHHHQHRWHKNPHHGRPVSTIHSHSHHEWRVNRTENEVAHLHGDQDNSTRRTGSSLHSLESEGNKSESSGSSHQSKRSNDWSDALIVPQYIQEMESSIASDNNGSDFVYATCDVQANRAISLLLQQNIQGRINLWQRKNTAGPVYSYIKLTGFRVLASSASSSLDQVSRGRRETVLMPVETSAQDAEKPDDAAKPIALLEHDFHVHSSGDLSKSCQSTGPHFNPTGNHGGPDDLPRHMGHLGTLKCKSDGTIDSEFTYPHVSLLGEHSIVGRSLVIHSAVDHHALNGKMDDASKGADNSGVRIACCVVQPVSTLPPMEDSPSLIGSLIVPSANAIDSGRK